MIFQPCSSAACHFDKVATMPIIYFEVFIFVMAAASLFFLSKITDKIFLRFAIIALGVFIFEFFTAPMWHNFRLGELAYVYRDVSWVLTIGWSTIILVPVVLIDKYLVHFKEWHKFLLYLLFVFIIALWAEKAVVGLGIRAYAPESLEVIKDHFVPWFNIPWSSFYYIPVFMTLVIGFYKYWSLVIDKKLLIPMKKIKWGRELLIVLLAVIFFEIMIEPMVLNANLPAWSYFYRDVSILMSGIWIIIIWLAIGFVDKFLVHFNLIEKFIAYLLVAGIITTPIEAWLIASQYRVYGPSTVANFSGYTLPFTSVPIEVIFAVPFYLALIIASSKYWIYILENRRKNDSSIKNNA
ncbi:hypothetical protein HOB10_01560 [Candidatus Parcubacteria bacterium]|jgi:hypothetical protein|nr:hypothetical protein [Candidatus Parcubacteria bacterium]